MSAQERLAGYLDARQSKPRKENSPDYRSGYDRGLAHKAERIERGQAELPPPEEQP